MKSSSVLLALLAGTLLITAPNARGMPGITFNGFWSAPNLNPESAPYIYGGQPASATVVEGNAIQLFASVSGNPTPTLQWRKNRVAIAGQTSNSLTISDPRAADAGDYDLVATNKHGSATSQVATVTVIAAVAPSITTQPANMIVELGKNAVFSVAATGVPAPTYQWRKNGIALAGATQRSLSVLATQPTDAGAFDVVVTNSAGSVTSAAAILTIGTPPTESVLQPASMLINWGAIATFDFVATGKNVRYQWKKNGVPIPGATNHSFTVSSATAADMGFYSAVATGDGGTVESEAAVLTIDSMSFWSFTTLAGVAGSNANVDGSGATARFNAPNGLAIDDAGNLYVADSKNHALRKISPDGTVTTLATGLDTPDGVAIDRAGTIYVADWGRHVIYRISREGAVSLVAGRTGEAGAADGPAATARFNNPAGVAVDQSGNLFVAENSNHTIRKITPDGIVSTFAGKATVTGAADGPGADARFYWPNGVAIDGNGVIYVTDAWNATIRRITPSGDVTTYAGRAGNTSGFTGDGTGRNATFNSPAGIAVDDAGNVYVADTWRNTIRKISPSTEVTTIAGNSFGSADGISGDARFNVPYAIALDRAGHLYVTDNRNSTIRKGVLLTGTSVPSRLVNLSTRGFVPAGGALTPGFTLRGSGSKQLVIRAAGPALAAFGIAGALNDPKLALVPAGTTTAILANDDWGTGSNPAAVILASNIVGAFPFASGSRDAALLATLSTASGLGYSAPITASSAMASGIALAEIYDPDPLSASVRLGAVSTLGFVGAGTSALIPGFVIGGKEPKRLLIRAVGPGLTSLGVGGALADPQIAVIPANQSFTVARNDNWGGDPILAEGFARAGAFALASDSKDAALIVRLPPGAYTVTVSGVGNTTGTALVEIYDLDP